MKKIISVFIAAFVSLLLCSGLFVSCSTKDDDSDTDRAYAEALSYTKLTNIAIILTTQRKRLSSILKQFLTTTINLI